MADVVFLLGAGASKTAGAPLMGEFLDVADMLLKMGQVTGDDAKSFEKVFEGIGSLQRVYSKANLDISNVESVFAAFEMGKTLGQFVGYEGEEIDELISAMRVLIVRTLEETITFSVDKNNRVHPPEPYDKFVALVNGLRQEWSPKRSVAVITFNYDIALDYAFAFKHQDVDYSLPVYDAKSDAIPILKLHGSLNWARLKNDAQTIVPRRADGFKPKYGKRGTGTAHIPAGSCISDFEPTFGQEVEPEPVIVPPTWNKADYHRGLSVVWSRAARELSEAESIICIGFSLNPTDSFFKYLYSLGTVGERPLKRFWVFDPAIDKVEKRYRDMLGIAAEQRFEPFALKFSDAIDKIKYQIGDGGSVWLL